MASDGEEAAAMATSYDAPSDCRRSKMRQPHPSLAPEANEADCRVVNAYLTSLNHVECLHLRRKAAFKAREVGKATDRMFILSDDRPWVSFTRETRLQRRKWAFEACGALQWPALHCASCSGDLEAVKKALSTRQRRGIPHPTPQLRGVQCALRRDASGRLALHHAVVCERWEVVKYLLKRPDAPLQLRVTDNSHRTAVHYALEKMERLAMRHPSRPTGSSISLATVMMRENCPRYRRLWRTVDRMLLKMNTLTIQRPSQQGDEGDVETVEQLELRCRGDLWDACRAGDVKRLEFIMKVYYHDVSPLDTDVVLSELRWSLLHEACNQSNTDVVHFLLTHERLKSFRDVKMLLLQDTSGCTALHCASRQQALGICALLVDYGDSNSSVVDTLALTQDACGRTALHWCLLAPTAITSVEYTPRAVVAKFLARQCSESLHVRDCDGLTPLHLAVWRGDVELVQYFLDLGADANGADPLQTINRHGIQGCERSKAVWAPCGLKFQQRKAAESVTNHEDKGDQDDRDSSSVDTMIRDQRPDSHLFECPGGLTDCEDSDDESAAYYWIRRMTARRCDAVSSPSGSEKTADLPLPCRSPVERYQGVGESIGCLKYGGSCDQCRPVTRALNPSTDNYTPLPPLILALRVCSSVATSKLSNYITIIELLLASGAQPDGSLTVDEDSSTLEPFDSLLEALRTDHSSLLLMLLHSGATRLNVDILDRYVSSDWSVETLENLLSPLLRLPDVVESDVFIATLFVHKCFNTLSQATDSTSLWTEQRSVWRVVRRHLETSTSRRRRQVSKSDSLVDSDHLTFLSRAAEDLAPQAGVSLDTTALTELIDFCIDSCLRSWAHPKTRCSREPAMAFHTDEAVLMSSIRHTTSVNSVNLELIIACGFFQTATAVLEAQLASGEVQFSLDTIFRAVEAGTRLRVHRRVGSTQSHTADFLCVWLSKLLLGRSDQSAATVSLQSVVLVCAHNLPLGLIERCLEVIAASQLDSEHEDPEQVVEAMKTVRVRGQQLEHWLVLHRRIDVVHAVLRVVCSTSHTAWRLWRELMAATVASYLRSKDQEKEGAESCRQWTAELLALPSTVEVMASTMDEFELEIVEWLVIERVVPTDCEGMIDVLLSRLWQLNQQRVPSKLEGDGEKLKTPTLTDQGDANKSLRWLSNSRLIYFCARWNAVRVLRHVVEAVGVESGEEDANKWLSIAASRVDAVDECSAIDIARLLGHLDILRALTTSSVPSQPTTDQDTHQSWYSRHFGFLQAVLATHNHIKSAPSSTEPTARLTRLYYAAPSISEDLETACRSNRVHHLAMLLSIQAPAPTPQLLSQLVLSACSNGAIDVLALLLRTFTTSNLTEVDRNTSIQLVVRRMTGQGGELFVDVLLLLLNHSFPPGRLAGDGGETTLLHHAACVHNSVLAQRIISHLVSLKDCDVNVLDSHGNTPVMYALASGRLENACFLIQHGNCRLEAEFEGQASFYYTLHLVPNPSARFIIKEILQTKRSHAFLHCEGDSGACACKSFEGLDGGGGECCGFCGHDKLVHAVLPLPSWFRDQYDSYVDGRLVGRSKPEPEDDDDYNGRYQEQPSGSEATEVVTDGDLEDGRGRLDADDLVRLALIRYEPILSNFGLPSPPPLLDSPSHTSPDADTKSDAETTGFSIWSMVELHVLDDCESQLTSCQDDRAMELSTQSSIVDSTSQVRTSQLPWFVRTDVEKLHPLDCACQRLAFATSRQMLLHLAASRWLRFTVVKTLGSNWQVQHAFTSWRLTTEPISTVLPPSWPLQAVESLLLDPNKDLRRARMLKRATIAHWRLGLRALAAFRAWKHHSLSPELAHHALEDAALNISTDMRRHRLETLQVRQLQVQQEALAITFPSCIHYG